MNALAPISADEPLADSLLNFVARAMSDPAINVDKLQMLLTMQREIVADDARLRFARAMSAAQADMQPVLRDATNDQTRSKYARLETIDAAVRPIYTRHGFCLEYNSEAIEGPNERIVCEVSHTAGHSKRFQLEAAPDTVGPQGKANKTALHGLGSTISYLRRYLLCLAFNIQTSDDNDGQRQSRPVNDSRLSELQVQELEKLMRQTYTAEDRFLAVMCPGLSTVAHAAAADFPRLKNALLAKARQIAARTGVAA